MRVVCVLTVLSLGAWGLRAQGGSLPSPPEMPGATVEAYKTIGDAKLNLYIFNPPGGGAATKRAAIVFFFGGGWKGGSPGQFAPQCRHIASLGMVAIAADYRVLSRHRTTVAESVRDAKSAMRYVRRNAARLGIDPERIAAGGGSSGGQLAAATGVIDGMDEPGEDRAVSSRANALVLFNPAVVMAPMGGDAELDRYLAEHFAGREELRGVDLAALSPWHQVGKNAPPTILFHGKADTTVPYATAEAFAKKMRAAGNRCELVGFDGQKHGFFNYSAKGNTFYDSTLRGAEEFLASLGYLRLP